MAAGEPVMQQQIHTLYQDHHSWLCGWLYRRLGCSHRAADLAQDTFLRLLAREESITVNKPRALLTTVARRVLSNHWRRERIERAYLETLAQTPEWLAPSAEQRNILIDTLYELDCLLDGLPVAVRRAFLYAQLDGMTHAEIARALDISISTVKRYLVRAAGQCYFALSVD